MKILNTQKQKFLRGTHILLATCFVLMFGLLALGISGCAPEQKDESSQSMIDYYNTEEVYTFHNEVKVAYANIADALHSEDSKKLKSSLDRLDEICDDFIANTNVPDSLTEYHDKMVETAELLKKYTQAVRDENIDEAADIVEEVQKGLEEAQKLFPDQTE